MDENTNQLAFKFNENPVDNQVVDNGAVNNNAIPTSFVEGYDEDERQSPAPQVTKKMTLFDEKKVCGPNGYSVAVASRTNVPPPPKDFLNQPIPTKPTTPEQHLTAWFKTRMNTGVNKSSSPVASAKKSAQQQPANNATVKKPIQQQAAPQQKSLVIPSPKFGKSPMKTAPANNNVAPPQNNPPAQKPVPPTLPVINQDVQQQQQNQANQLIRPTSRVSSKVIYPSLLWDGSITITNMKKATGVSNNKNYLQNNIAPTPYVQIYQLFPAFENVEFLRYLIGQESIFLSYLLPRSSNARRLWKYNLTNDPEFYNRVIAYNEEQKKIIADMNGITIEDVNKQINSILQTYLTINADRINKKTSFSGYKKQCNTCNNMMFSGYTSSNVQNDISFAKCSGSSCPDFNGSDLNNCLANNPHMDGFNRVIYSVKPCNVMYQKIENEDDLQKSMIGTMSAIQRIASDNDCTVKYNMIKNFLDETGYHLVKNSKPKSKKSSRKN